MDYLKLTLRLIHVVAGAFWFGSAMMMGFFISPAVAATAEAGQRFIGHLISKARLHVILSVAGTLTILAGLGLYLIDSNGFTSQWTTSGPGLVFGIGGIFGLIGLIFGFQIGTNISAIVKVGSQVQGKPTPEQMSQIQGAQKTLGFVGPVSSFSLIIAMVCMAVARYWF
jgi:uncharacterized membrane protein